MVLKKFFSISLWTLFLLFLFSPFVCAAPTIYSSLFEITSSGQSLVYNVSADVVRVELEQATQTSSELIFGGGSGELSVKKFEDLTFKVYDEEGNFAEKTFLVDNAPSVLSLTHYISHRVFSLTSTASECRLTEFEGDVKDVSFTLQNTTWYLPLDISEEGNYSLHFFCEQGGIRKYFETWVVYDETSPKPSLLSAQLLKDGSISLHWEEGSDGSDSLSYLLYRNNSLIYEGKRFFYNDLFVSWPQQYDYVLVVKDEAGNEAKSNELHLVPKKVGIFFQSNLKREMLVHSSLFLLHVETDKNNTLTTVLRSENATLYNATVLVEHTEMEVPLYLQEGLNVLSFSLRDEEGNEKKEEYFLIYTSPELGVTQESVLQNSSANFAETELTKIEQRVEEEQKNRGTSIFWILMWLVFLIFFVYAILMYGDAVSMRFEGINKERVRKKEQMLRRRSDTHLDKFLRTVRAERMRKLEERKLKDEERKKKEGKRQLSSFQKQKFKELERQRTGNKQVLSSVVQRKAAPQQSSTKSLLERAFQRLDKKTHEVQERQKTEKKTPIFKGFLDSYLSEQKQKKEEQKIRAHLEREKITFEKHREEAAAEEKKKREAQRVEQEKQRQVQEEKDRVLKEKQRQHEEEREHEKNVKGLHEKKEEQQRQREEKVPGLQDYLSKRKKKRLFFFAEKEVERDLRKRERE